MGTAAGSTGGCADGAGTVAQFNGPAALLLTEPQTLYVAEEAGNRIRKVTFLGEDSTVATNYVVSLAAGDAAAGASGTSNGFGIAVRLSWPGQMVKDPQGNIYRPDWTGHRIRKLDPGGIVTSYAGGSASTATSGYVDNNVAVDARFSGPYGLTLDSAGYKYVAEYSGRRIRRISPGGAVTTVAGSGGASVTDGPGDVAVLGAPSGLYLKPTGELLMSDVYSLRQIQNIVASAP
ncbi:MAG: hypothetical protein ABUL72_03250 [Armatimonadota bacterium]